MLRFNQQTCAISLAIFLGLGLGLGDTAFAASASGIEPRLLNTTPQNLTQDSNKENADDDKACQCNEDCDHCDDKCGDCCDDCCRRVPADANDKGGHKHRGRNGPRYRH
jgi:hypothetical protein